MNTLDVQGLPDNQIQFLQQLIEFLRQKFQASPLKDEAKMIHFCSWSLGVKGELSREEIYDYLYDPTDGTS